MQTDLFFQIWFAELLTIDDFKETSIELIINAYNDKLTPCEAYFLIKYLPF